ncbi:MAG: DEAD/DEAH box helicase [Hyphomicrobiales bacterium]|nr:DEAD/DEAH box helicase [Hyphomicrobiales bacterium]
MTSFNDFGLSAPILKALADEGYVTPTPIQAQALPHVLAGKDILGIAQTGTGKTAAFALPILDRLSKSGTRPQPRSCRALILSPTRELASQIELSFRTYGKFLRLHSTVIFGGVPVGRQIRTCAAGLDIVVATPGRLLDLINQRALSLNALEVFVLDEADQMLDMGFIHDIRKIVALLPAKRQSLFFSATMPKEMAELSDRLLTNPAKVTVTPVASTVERIAQQVVFSETRMKQALLHKLLEDASISRALVFTRTKHGADRVVKHLATQGIVADAIHGNKSQGQRERALAAFRDGRSRLLVATDIAARGIDIDGVSHVINFDLPNVPESYVHRIGRTARAGAAGIAISFCDHEERAYLRDIERLTRQRVPVLDNPLGPEAEMLRDSAPAQRPRQHRRPQGRNGAPQGQRPAAPRQGTPHNRGQRPQRQG